MRWPWKRKLVLLVGEVYEIGTPHIKQRRQVRLMEMGLRYDGTIHMEFLPEVHE